MRKKNRLINKQGQNKYKNNLSTKITHAVKYLEMLVLNVSRELLSSMPFGSFDSAVAMRAQVTIFIGINGAEAYFIRQI